MKRLLILFLILNCAKKDPQLNNNNVESENYLFQAVSAKDVGKIKKAHQEKLDPNIQDERGNTPLHHAILISAGINIVNAILDINPNLTVKDVHGNTPLHTAIIVGDEESFIALISKGAKMDIENEEDKAVLYKAIECGTLGIIECIINAGLITDINRVDRNNNTLLHIACKRGEENILKYFLKSPDLIQKINERNFEGDRPISLLVKNGHKTALDILVKDYNINLNGVYDAQKNSLLHIACMFSNIDMVTYLLSDEDKDKNIDLKNSDGLTALHIASKKGYAEIVELLLIKGANINAKIDDNWTALHLASQEGHEEVVKVLLERKANIDEEGKFNGTALHIASKNGYAEIVELLLIKGANINAKIDNNWTALHIASEKGYEKIIEVLLEKEANVNEKDNIGWTSLHIASKNGYAEIVELLLNKGANINAKNSKNFTALHVASWMGRIEVVDLLLAKGADINATDKNNWTALNTASYNKQEEVVNILVRRGAKLESQLQD